MTAISRLKTIAVTVLALVLLAAVGDFALVYSGTYSVAATVPHWRATYWVMEAARIRSIKAHAAGIVVPAGFDDGTKVVAAAGHFSAHCAVCHGGPGVEPDDLATGMYPKPPDLTDVSKRYTPAELFWIVKNGIKMSGMPSMADDGDDMLWATVAFLQKLPGLTPEQYDDVRMEARSEGNGGHGMANMEGMKMGGATEAGGGQQAPVAVQPAAPVAHTHSVH